MIKPTRFETWKKLSKLVKNYPGPEEVIKNNIERLLCSLYIPTKRGFEVDRDKLKKFGLENEPVNWGGLHGIEVFGDCDTGFVILVSEASPDACKFREFICDFLCWWGWPIKEVITEW